MPKAKTKTWPPTILKKITDADDLKISPFREDGKTYGTPTWIWNVEAKGDLYVRAYHGQKSSWYQAALKQRAGRIHAAGMVKEVSFEPVDVDRPIHNLIDKGYKAKYGKNVFFKSMVSKKAKLATIKIIPK